MMSSPAASIQTRTLLWSSPRQVPMAHNLRFRKENLQIPEKIDESRFLLSRHGVARLALLIEPSLIADADRASIIRSGMSPHLQQLTMLRHRSILSDVEMIADVIKPTSLMVTSQLFHTIVLIASGSRAMQNQIFNVASRHILTLSHNSTFNIQHSTLSHSTRTGAYSQCCKSCNQSLNDSVQNRNPRNLLGTIIKILHNQKCV